MELPTSSLEASMKDRHQTTFPATTTLNSTASAASHQQIVPNVKTSPAGSLLDRLSTSSTTTSLGSRHNHNQDQQNLKTPTTALANLSFDSMNSVPIPLEHVFTENSNKLSSDIGLGLGADASLLSDMDVNETGGVGTVDTGGLLSEVEQEYFSKFLDALVGTAGDNGQNDEDSGFGGGLKRQCGSNESGFSLGLGSLFFDQEEQVEMAGISGKMSLERQSMGGDNGNDLGPATGNSESGSVGAHGVRLPVVDSFQSTSSSFADRAPSSNPQRSATPTTSSATSSHSQQHPLLYSQLSPTHLTHPSPSSANGTRHTSSSSSSTSADTLPHLLSHLSASFQQQTSPHTHPSSHSHSLQIGKSHSTSSSPLHNSNVSQLIPNAQHPLLGFDAVGNTLSVHQLSENQQQQQYHRRHSLSVANPYTNATPSANYFYTHHQPNSYLPQHTHERSYQLQAPLPTYAGTHPRTFPPSASTFQLPSAQHGPETPISTPQSQTFHRPHIPENILIPTLHNREQSEGSNWVTTDQLHGGAGGLRSAPAMLGPSNPFGEEHGGKSVGGKGKKKRKMEGVVVKEEEIEGREEKAVGTKKVARRSFSQKSIAATKDGLSALRTDGLGASAKDGGQQCSGSMVTPTAQSGLTAPSTAGSSISGSTSPRLQSLDIKTPIAETSAAGGSSSTGRGGGGSSTTGKRRSGKELLTEEEKRANHILSEQKRRNLIRIGFQTLTELVPGLRPSATGGFISDIPNSNNSSHPKAAAAAASSPPPNAINVANAGNTGSGSSKSLILTKTVSFIEHLERVNAQLAKTLEVVHENLGMVERGERMAREAWGVVSGLPGVIGGLETWEGGEAGESGGEGGGGGGGSGRRMSFGQPAAAASASGASSTSASSVGLPASHPMFAPVARLPSGNDGGPPQQSQ
ncbi:hypothetical protein HDV05_002233 [Chytridiales sp. JEL 0842]|nr:hypothetical protein HDV05_002233 [Chytridiales sp. JEL 0842]